MTIRARFVTVSTTVLAIAAAWVVHPSAAPDAGQFYAAIRTNDLARVRALASEDPNVRDDRGVTPLMTAAAFGSVDAMRTLIDAGADVNAVNDGRSTALMWSVTDAGKVRLLLNHGADVNLASSHGRTALFLAAMSDQSADIVRLLLKAGAKSDVVDTIGITTLAAATFGGDEETIRLLVDAGVDVNAADAAGYTPLMNAAQRGRLGAVTLLLARGANVNAVSDRGDVQTHANRGVKNGPTAIGHLTALILAAATEQVDVMRTLLDAGADVNAADVRGMTPLISAVASDHADPAAVQLLLARHADTTLKDTGGESALDWARKFGRTRIAALLERAGAPASTRPAHEIPPAAPVAAPAAVARSISLLERSTGQFFTAGGCASCHAHTATDAALAAARASGFAIDPALALKRVDQSLGRVRQTKTALLERVDLPGTPDGAVTVLNAVADAGLAPEEATDALAVNLASQQLADGRWFLGGLKRPPIQDGDITRTAQAIRALKDYMPPARAAETRSRIGRAASWLKRAVPATTQDRNMQILGLAWSGADTRSLKPLVATVIATQRSDGGWAQRDELASDAYATGQTIAALVEAAGLTGADAAIARGLRYLLSTQRADGSWFVASRAPKFQPYFEGGFPYGGDQWISSMATGLATRALAMTSKAGTAATR